METTKTTRGHLARTQLGDAVLAAAGLVDTRTIAARLAGFTAAHHTLLQAQRALDAALVQESDTSQRLATVGADVDQALERLVLALQHDGHSRISPFAAYGGESPSSLKVMRIAEKPAAVQTLLIPILRDERLSAATLETAQQVGHTVAVLSEATRQLGASSTTVRQAREARDQLAAAWEEALAALKRGARAAADEGAPTLYDDLFAHTTKVKATKVKAENTEPPAQAA